MTVLKKYLLFNVYYNFFLSLDSWCIRYILLIYFFFVLVWKKNRQSISLPWQTSLLFIISRHVWSWNQPYNWKLFKTKEFFFVVAKPHENTFYYVLPIFPCHFSKLRNTETYITLYSTLTKYNYVKTLFFFTLGIHLVSKVCIKKYYKIFLSTLHTFNSCLK